MIERVLHLAIQSAGDNSDPVAWRKRILTAIGDISGMMSPYALEWQLADRLTKSKDDGGCHVFVAEYRGYRIEGSSTRCIVSLFDDRDQTVQEIRTERTDELLGAVMQERLDAIAPGTKLRCWRYSEVISKDKKVGVLAHVEPVDATHVSRNATTAAPQKPPVTAPPPEPVAEAALPLDHPADPGAAPTSSVPPPDYQAAFERLTSRQKVELAKAGMALQPKINDVYNPSPDDAARLMKLMERL